MSQFYKFEVNTSADFEFFGRLLAESFFGGVIAFTPVQYKRVNGHSNAFWGWGGEDTDLYNRFVTFIRSIFSILNSKCFKLNVEYYIFKLVLFAIELRVLAIMLNVPQVLYPDICPYHTKVVQLTLIGWLLIICNSKYNPFVQIDLFEEMFHLIFAGK